MGDAPAISKTWDVFVSYGHADEAWVKTLAENLHQLGLDVFFDQWEIGAGDVLVHRLDAGLLGSRAGVLVVSPASMASKYVGEEYASLMRRAIEKGQRLIPVLLMDAAMPELLANRIWIDFRSADGPDYLARVRELADALKDTRPGPPPRTGELKLPPKTCFAATGTRACRLTITAGRTTLSTGGTEVAGSPPKPAFDFGTLTWNLQRARDHWGTSRDAEAAAAAHGGLESLLHDLGGRLKDAFLPAEVAAALAAQVAEAQRLNSPLELALDVAAELPELPWETLRLDAPPPLALHPRVDLYRRIATGGPAAALSPIPGPLRILVAIGSPEAQNARGELLDMEAETQRILDATEAPRRAGKAFVHILEQGTVAAIQAALAKQKYHVLHVSCHAAPGALVLEDTNGGEDRVSAARLCDEAIPAGRQPPLVVLAGCSTGQDAADATGATKLPGLARALVSQGVPAVIAMQASVGDRYATELMGTVYAALAQWEEPRPLAALAHARRQLETKRRAETRPPPEWATPALFTAATPQRLFNPKDEFEDLREAPDPTFDPGVVVRRIGDMVGRRREQRLILRALRDKDGAGVLLHGIGGVGKSTLAAQILHRLADDDRYLLMSVEGATDPDGILWEIGQRLLDLCEDRQLDERHALRSRANEATDRNKPWRHRLATLCRKVFNELPVAFLFDNFEDNLSGGTPPDELAELLARWLAAPGLSRLVFTSRHPFSLPDDAHDRLAPFHLGPLSWAETRKLLWRLDGLKALPADEQRRAWESIGGHPRALEYLDAILRGGKAKFADVSRKLRKQLKEKGIADPGRWCTGIKGGLDAALAEAVTLAADDVLLDQLLVQLADEPLARKLLIGAAVYRVPVDELGLIWQVGEPVEHAPDPERATRLQAFEERFSEVRKESPLAEVSEFVAGLADGEQRLLFADLEEGRKPPVAAPAGFAAARERLMDLSLLAPVRFAEDEEEKFFVHRWTATALESRATAEEQTEAHRAAAAYWRWRFDKLQQSREQDIADLLEARHHLHALGDTARAYAVSGDVILQLDTWGAWEWEERLIHETLAWMPVDSPEFAGLLGRLGSVSACRGDYDRALEFAHKSLALKERIGNRAGMGASYQQLGNIALGRGDYDAAFDWFCKARTVFEQLGERSSLADIYYMMGNVEQSRLNLNMAIDLYSKGVAIFGDLGRRDRLASSYAQLGQVFFLRGDYSEASDWNSKSLTIFEQLGDLRGLVTSYQTMGGILLKLSDYTAALESYRKSLAISEQIGYRAGMAASLYQLGRVAELRGDHDAALDWYRKSLGIEEQLGNRAGMAKSYSQIGVLYTETGRAAEAVPLNLQSLALRLQMQSPEASINLRWLSRQRRALGADAFRAIVAEHRDAESMANLLQMLDDYDKEEKS